MRNKYYENIVPFAVLGGPAGPGHAYTNGICTLLEHAQFKQRNVVISNTFLRTAKIDEE